MTVELDADKLIEAMARAMQDGYASAWDDLDDDDKEFAIEQATAAYTAMRDALVPVGWLYVRKPNAWPPARNIVQKTRWAEDDGARIYWTETPIYALPEIKP